MYRIVFRDTMIARRRRDSCDCRPRASAVVESIDGTISKVNERLHLREIGERLAAGIAAEARVSDRPDSIGEIVLPCLGVRGLRIGKLSVRHVDRQAIVLVDMASHPRQERG